jgi:FG-GAP-like repeat/Bacterial Ig domain
MRFTTLIRRSFSFTLLLFIAITSSAQNMMTRRYSVASDGLGPISRGDFNEDGIPDVVFQTSTGVAVALGRPQGTLGTVLSSNTSLPGGLNLGDLAVARFTSSGHLDVAVRYRGAFSPGDNSYDEMDVLLGRGDGTFQIGPRLDFGGAVISLTAADLNADGKTDLAVIDAASTVYIFPGNGNGTFGALTPVPTGLVCCFQQYKIRVGDFDADGRPDLAVKDGSTITVLFNNGNLVFEPKDVSVFAPFSLLDFAAQDVNQDGYTDILVALQGEGPPAGPNPAGFSVYTSTGRAREFIRAFHRDPDFTVDSAFDLTAADVDGDGINDIVGLAPVLKSGIFVFKGLPNGSFSSTPLSFVIGDIGVLARLVSLDINRDGRPDFVTIDSSDSMITTSLNAVPRAACANSTRSPSVTACRPADNAYLRSPVRITAKTTDTAAPVTSVQVYVDHKLVKSVPATSLDTQVPLSLGARLIVVKAWDAAGRNFRTDRRVNIYSGTPGQVCSTSPNALNICAPAQNSSVSSPVRVFAAAHSDFVITSVQVYIDNQLVFRDPSANYVDRTFTLGSGSHTIVVKYFDERGRKFSQSRTIMVP